jgi:hypothetical protein
MKGNVKCNEKNLLTVAELTEHNVGSYHIEYTCIY